MFEPFWISMSEKCTVQIKGHEFLSYLSDVNNVCWFMLPEFKDAIKRLHRLVGNAEIDNRHIVVGTGATQLFQAALFALSPSDNPNPINVVAASPYYSVSSCAFSVDVILAVDFRLLYYNFKL